MKKINTPKLLKGNDDGGKFVERNIMKMNPKRDADQCAPTPAEPVRQKFKMAGGC